MKPTAWHPLHMAIGLTLWLVWFTLVYGGSAVACAAAAVPAEAGARNLWNAGLLVLTLLFVLGFGTAAWRCGRAAARLRGGGDAGHQRQCFFASVAAALYGVAAVSTAVVALPLAVLGPCV